MIKSPTDTESKTCSVCKELKSLSNFGLRRRSDGSLYHQRACNDCCKSGRTRKDVSLIKYKIERRENTPDGMAYCTTCDTYKSPEEFHKARRTPNGLRFDCKDCAKQRYQENRSNEVKRMRRRHIATEFGINERTYQELFTAQGGVCAICGKPETKMFRGSVSSLSIDHDHDTGKIRGLLCSSCNLGLGYFKDSIESLSNAIDYLMGTHR